MVHEFCHSYCNPLVDKHTAELQDSAIKIYKRVRKAMSQMAYGNWQTMMRESLVRACVIRYLLAKFGEDEAQKGIQSEETVLLGRQAFRTSCRVRAEPDRLCVLG